MRAAAILFSQALLWISLAPAAGATTVDFETPSVSDGTTVTTQFAAAKGVTFVSGAPAGAAALPAMRVSAAEARAGTDSLNVSTDTQEFPHPDFAGAFSTTRTTVSLYARTVDANITLRLDAFDSGGATVASSPQHTLTNAGGYALFTATAGTPAIAYFRLHSTNAVASGGVRVDDLSYDDPVVVQPDFAIESATTFLHVSANSTTQIPLTINRVNGSNGAILLSDSSGSVDVAFSPNPVPATATSVMATVTTPGTPATFTVTITGTPQVAGAGASARSFPLTVLTEYPAAVSAAPGTTAVDLPPCSTAQSQFSILRGPGVTSPVHVGVPGGMPAGVTAGFDPAPLTGFGSLTTATFTRGDDVLAPADGHLQVISSAEGYGLQDVLPFTTHLLPSTVTAATGPSGTSRGRAPQALAGGDTVTLSGSGLCPGSSVRFGNQAATAPLTLAPGGGSGTVSVPLLATDGPLTVVSPAGRETPGPRSFDIESYRGTNGFQFENEPYRGDINSWFGLYGLEQFFLQVDPCAVLTFGAAHCPVPSPIPNPLSYLVFAVGDPALASANGSCFGFALASRRIATGRGPSPAAFGGSSTVWSIPVGTQIRRYIWSQHVAQLSAEVLAQIWKQRTGGALSVRSPGELRSRIESAIRSGGRPLLSLAFFTRGHAVNAYDIVDVRPDGGFTIRIYDNNVPHTRAEDAADGAAAQQGEANSRIVVDGSGRWTLPTLGWSGGLGDIVVINDRTLPDKPTLPSSPEGIITMIFGAGAPAKGAAGAHAAAASSGMRSFPIPDDATPSPLLVGDDERAHRLRVRPGKGGRIDAMVAGGGHSARVSAAGASGTTVLTSGRLASAVGLSFGRADGVSLALAGGGAAGASRSLTAALTGALTGGDELVAQGDGYVLNHRGGAATLRISLAAAGGGTPGVFKGDALPLSGPGTVSVAPDWAHLERPLRVVVRDATGGYVVHRANRARPGIRVASVRVKATRRGRVVTVVVTARLTGRAAARAAGAIGVVVRRGAKVVARAGLAGKAKTLRRSTIKLTLPKRAKGPWSVRASVTSVGSGRVQSAPSTAQARMRLR